MSLISVNSASDLHCTLGKGDHLVPQGSGVPQGSILGPLLINIFLCDLFLTIKSNYFTNYADDTTSCVIGKNAEEVVSELKAITQKLFT